MKINILNDIHLEFDAVPTIDLIGDDILLLAGDICVADYLRPNRTDKLARKHVNVVKAFFHEQCAKYQKVYYIMGNHEHYNGVFDNTADILREFLKDTNVVLLDNEFVDLDDTWRLFGGTLWTDYHDQDWFAMQIAKTRMSDHTIINKIKPVANPYGEVLGRFLPVDAYAEHNKTLEVLENNIQNRPTIVMTHHAPTYQSVHPRFIGDMLNYAYASDLSGFILNNPNIKYWMHGHMHDNWNYEVGDCRVICNPRGYNDYEVNEGFDPNMGIEI